MDVDNSISTSVLVGVDQNGVHDDDPCQGKESTGSEKPDGVQEGIQVFSPEIDSEVDDGSNNGQLTDPSTQEAKEHTKDEERSNSLPAPGEAEVQQKYHENNSNGLKHQGKVKSGKSSDSRNIGAVGMKRAGNGKEAKADANGTQSTTLQPKQPVLRSKSFNNGQNGAHIANKMIKQSSATSDAHKQRPVKPNSPNAMKNNVQAEGQMKKTKVKPYRTGPQLKTQGDSESTLSPRSEDGIPRRVGKLPSYSFNFKCNERAERRREFISKLEEKIQAKEEEIINQEAKSKETQAAEIKMLRKSLNFKATPMPSFYQEPAPAKVELKKMPTTRPKSPKLGRRKDSPATEGEGNGGSQPGRLSLGSRVPESKSSRLTSSIQPKKPLRKSLPKLPSEKSALSSKASDKTAQETGEKATPHPKFDQEADPNSELSQATFVPGIESADMIEEDSKGTPISSELQPAVTVEN